MRRGIRSNLFGVIYILIGPIFALAIVVYVLGVPINQVLTGLLVFLLVPLLISIPISIPKKKRKNIINSRSSNEGLPNKL